jgi:hypothetical protein
MPEVGISLPFCENTPLALTLQLPRKSKKRFPVCRKAPIANRKSSKFLVRAARKQRHKHHQVRQREQPLVRLLAGCYCSARDKAQVPAFREVANVIHADASQSCNFCVGENLLAGFDSNHGLIPLACSPHRASHFLMLSASYAMHPFKSNSSSVLSLLDDWPSTFVPTPCVKRHYAIFRRHKLTGTCMREWEANGQLCPIFANSLRFSVGSLQFLASVLCAGLRGTRETASTHRC